MRHQPVSIQAVGGIAVVTVDHPPNNALVSGVRSGLVHAFDRIEQTPAVTAVVLAARGRGYASGADPDDAADAAAEPAPGHLAARIEACRRPVIAALQGPVTGAGLELAIAAHYRIADRRARLSFPDIRLGLIPGAGGTQRLPRLVGVERALDLLLSGRAIDAAVAARFGLVDAVATGPLPVFVLDWIRTRLAEGLPPRPSRARTGALQPAGRNLSAFERIRNGRSTPLSQARAMVVDCVEASVLLPFAAGLAMERAAYDDCLASPLSRALRHVAAAEARSARPPAGIRARPAKLVRVGIVGAGRMGRDIAAACLDGGFRVTLVERDIDRLEDGVEGILDIFDREIGASRMDATARDTRLARLTGKTDPAALDQADMVIEATPDDPASKARVFAGLDRVMRPGAVLATTTSGLDIDGLAATTGRAEAVVGLHFFPPAYRIRALEVVVGAETSAETVATAYELARRIGKYPAASVIAEGFLGHRMVSAFVDAALVLAAQGVPPAEVDAAMESYGCGLGPFKLADALGLDMLQKLQPPHRSEPGERIRRLLDAFVKAGRTGRRAGRGFYRHIRDEKAPLADPEADRIVAGHVATRPERTAEDIRRRCLAAMANQGAWLLDEGVAFRPSDIDLLMVHLFGFPRRRGGPMMAADITGTLRLKRDLDLFAPEAPELWSPAPLWTALLDAGRGFAALDD